MSKQIITIYSAYTHNSTLYSKALQELHPNFIHQTITATGLPFQRRTKQQTIQLFNELKYKAFNQHTPIIYIADKGLYKLEQHLIHQHLCKGLPVKLYTPNSTHVFLTPQDFTQYTKDQARQYYQRKQNKIYYQELLNLASQFNIAKAKLDNALIKHKDKLISQGKTINAYESYLGLLKQHIIKLYDEQHNIPTAQPEPQPESIDSLLNTPVEPTTEPHYPNYSLIDENTLIQLKALKLSQLKAAAKASHIKGYSKLNKAALINLLIPILYPETQITTESLDLHYNI